METNQQEKGNKKMLIGIIIALLLIVGVTLYFVFSGNQTLMATIEEKTMLDSNFRSLSDTLDARNSDIDRFKSKNIQLDSTVTASQELIAKEKKQIAGLLGSAKMTKKELAEATASIEIYKASINDLQKKVAELTTQNQALLSQNQELSTDLNAEKKTDAQLSEEVKMLNDKVTLGSLLVLTKVDVDGIKKRNNGKEVDVKNIKAVESLRITFETGTNKILTVGPLSLYVRIINPKGETIYLPNQGSGSFQLASNGSAMQYTKEAKIDWTQANKKVVVYWTQNITSAGTYKVEIYQSGHVIGTGAVKFG